VGAGFSPRQSRPEGRSHEETPSGRTAARIEADSDAARGNQNEALLAQAQTDLDEAERIARRGEMRLHLADVHLHRARLFADPAALAQARELIEQCGYGRRNGELEDAEAALPG
jgi:hypothetical protein